MGSILTILIPLFVNMIEGCINRKPTPADVKQAALDQWDETTGTFNQQFVEERRRQSKLAFKQAHRHDHSVPRHPTDEQLDAATVEALTQAKDGDDATLTAAIAMSHGEDA